MDARIDEMKYLAMLARVGGWKQEGPHPEDTPLRRMIAHLLDEGMLNDVGAVSWGTHQQVWSGATNLLEAGTRDLRTKSLAQLLSGQSFSITIGHRGRVRLAELEQQLKTGRDREPFGILLDGRYCERDLTIALLSASESNPVAVAFLDMNGLKHINDTHGHEAGNTAIKAYFHAISSVLEGSGEAYRFGGDEVVAVLPGMKAADARSALLNIIKQLATVKINGIEKLTTACGIAFGVSPDEPASALRDRADKVQYEAKRASKVEGRPSVLAVEGGKVEVL